MHTHTNRRARLSCLSCVRDLGGGIILVGRMREGKVSDNDYSRGLADGWFWFRGNPVKTSAGAASLCQERLRVITDCLVPRVWLMRMHACLHHEYGWA